MPSQKVSSRRSRALTVIFSVSGALVALKSLVTRLYEPDLWWQLALARQMIAESHVTQTEILSYTFLGAPYINFEWLAQLGFYGVWRVWGLPGLFVGKILAGVAIATLMARALWKWGGRGGILMGLWWAVFWALRPRLNERAELATLLALPVLLLLFRTGIFSVHRRRLVLLGAFVLTVFWSNAHGGWVLAPALAFFLSFGALWTREHRRAAPFLLGMSVIMTLGGLVNPYGPRLLLVHTIHLANLGRGSAIPAVIEEWGATSIAAAPVFWALLLACAIALVMGVLRRSPSARLWAPALLVFAASGAAYYRNAALFVFVAGPFLAMWIAEGGRKSRRWLILTVPVVVSLGVAAPSLTRPLPKTLVQWQRLPVGACEFLLENDIRGRMFNPLEMGGFIEWTLGPDQKVFIDGRYLFFPLVTELTDAVATGAVPALMQSFQVDHAVVNYGIFNAMAAPASALFPTDSWALVYWDDAALVYLRRTPAFAGVIAKREYRFAKPDGPLPPLSAADHAALQEEMARHRREVPFSIVAANLAEQAASPVSAR